MSFITWILLGLFAGYLASVLVNRHGEGLVVDIGLGIVGAISGGFLFRLTGQSGITGLNLWSLLVATLGATLVLLVFHGVRRIFRLRF